jgi:hypothetical protein
VTAAGESTGKIASTRLTEAKRPHFSTEPFLTLSRLNCFLQTLPTVMASHAPPAAASDAAATSDAATAVKEQEINPWSVEGALDEDGQVAAINYAQLSK